MKKCLLFFLLILLSFLCSGCFVDNNSQAYIEELESSYCQLQKEYDKLFNEVKGIPEKYDCLQIEYEDLSSDYERLSLEYKYLQADYTSLEEKYCELETLYEEMCLDCGSYEDEVIELKKEIDELKNKSN